MTSVLETNLTIQGNRLTSSRKGDELGGDPCCSHRHHRLMRTERALPGFSRTSGFYASSLVIIVMSGLLYILFKRKDWL